MKAWIISDLHISRLDLLTPRPLIIPAADICLCAGDIGDGISRSIEFLKTGIAPHMPVVATLGNHDYYGSSISGALEYARQATDGTDVHILEDNVFEMGELRVIGATLWTDYEIDAHDAGHLPTEVRREVAVRECMRRMTDFRQIIGSADNTREEVELVAPQEIVKRHYESRSFIESKLDEPFEGTTLVLSHHAPSPTSLDPQFDGHITNAAFASDLRSLIQKGRPDFWVHGHIHRLSDYVEGETRVICNPRGYHREAATSGFRPDLVVDMSVDRWKAGSDK